MITLYQRTDFNFSRLRFRMRNFKVEMWDLKSVQTYRQPAYNGAKNERTYIRQILEWKILRNPQIHLLLIKRKPCNF